MIDERLGLLSNGTGDRFKLTKQDQGEDAEVQLHQMRLAIPWQAVVWQDRHQVGSYSLGGSIGFGHDSHSKVGP
jgi:hypothetical protein